MLEAIDELKPEDIEEVYSPEKLADLALLNEKSEIRELVSEDYFIPACKGGFPAAKFGTKEIDTWVYPAVKEFRSY